MRSNRIVLAIDTSDGKVAEKLIILAKNNGATTVKFGLEFATAFSWTRCSELANKHSLNWIADAKLDDIPHTVEMVIANLCKLTPAPVGITVHIKAGVQALRLSQARAGTIIIFGVSE